MKGTVPYELQTLGIHKFRQIIIYVITDGRRDMKALLSRRLLG